MVAFVGGSLDAQFGDCLCDGELNVPVFAVTRWEMLYYFIFVLFWIYSLSDGERFCV